MSSTVIADYFNEKHVTFSELNDGSFRTFTSLFEDSRFSCCELLLRPTDRLEVIYNLPLRCSREEAPTVTEGLNEMNRLLKENECFELDMLTGLLRYRRFTDMPEDTDSLNDILNDSCSGISLFGDNILAVFCEASEEKYRAKSKKKFIGISIIDRLAHILGITDSSDEDE